MYSMSTYTLSVDFDDSVANTDATTFRYSTSEKTANLLVPKG